MSELKSNIDQTWKSVAVNPAAAAKKRNAAARRRADADRFEAEADALDAAYAAAAAEAR